MSRMWKQYSQNQSSMTSSLQEMLPTPTLIFSRPLENTHPFVQMPHFVPRSWPTCLLICTLAQFSSAGSAGQMALYWAPESSCSLVTWQTAYSALIEGDHAKCQGLAPSRVTEMITMSAATSATAPPRFTNVPTTSPATTIQHQSR